MKYRLLGKSGLRVSEAALGTITFGDEEGAALVALVEPTRLEAGCLNYTSRYIS